MTVPDLLKEKADLFEKKGKEYGNTYKDFGKVLESLDIKIKTKNKHDYNKIGIFFMMIHKFMRISKTLFTNTPSIDSIKDLQVYSAMLEEILIEEDYENG